MMKWLYRITAAAMFVILGGHSMAADLPSPAGEVILTIDGSIGRTNVAGAADFDLAMLEALPKATIKTATPWTEGVTAFEGVSLKDLLAFVNADGNVITASALNDYSAPLPAADAATGVIIAYKMNGEYMPVRKKGPLWIIYPLDDKPELKSEATYGRSVWQLRKLTISQ